MEKLLFVTLIAGAIGVLVALILPYPYNFFVSFPMAMVIGWCGNEIYNFFFG